MTSVGEDWDWIDTFVAAIFGAAEALGKQIIFELLFALGKQI